MSKNDIPSKRFKALASAIVYCDVLYTFNLKILRLVCGVPRDMSSPSSGLTHNIASCNGWGSLQFSSTLIFFNFSFSPFIEVWSNHNLDSLFFEEKWRVNIKNWGKLKKKNWNDPISVAQDYVCQSLNGLRQPHYFKWLRASSCFATATNFWLQQEKVLNFIN